jgi:3-hydroxybutyryl-CoA dehydrogenase
VEKIIVVGAGTMGAGIAFIAAAAGYAVDLIEPSSAAQDNAKQRIAKHSQYANILDAAARVNYYSRVTSGAYATLAIEAVPEDLQLKREVFNSLCAQLGPQTLLATNTSSLSVSEIAEGVKHPERVLGMHFFNPPAAMKLIEIVRGEQTSDEAVEQARHIAVRLGKTAVLAEDTPGFIVNRVARPFYLQALRAYEAGVAPMSDLDRLARGAGFPMGPFELMDRIGLDVNLATSESVYERTGAARLKPVDIQREFVARGRLGRKTGVGFYEYRQDARQHDDDVPAPLEEINIDERIVILGYAGVALELQALLSKRYAHVQLWQDEETIDDITLDTTMVFDVGDGVTDRTPIVERLDQALPPETAIFVDAYSSDLAAMAKRLSHPQRVIGYGILASLERQSIVEIVDAPQTGDDTLELAQDLFESIGCGVSLVANSAGLFLGRTVGSIINEAMYVVDEGVATAQDVDLAMRLGTNYPLGPIQWGREIGGDRVARILQRLAGAEGAAFAPHRMLWLLDVQDEEQAAVTAQFQGG